MFRVKFLDGKELSDGSFDWIERVSTVTPQAFGVVVETNKNVYVYPWHTIDSAEIGKNNDQE